MTQPSKKYVTQYTLRVADQYAVRGSGMRTQDRYRSEFMRDRDRILYSRALRRLAGKTQVFVTGVDDHMRTRLTHTLEVSQIARAIAAPLKLDVDLVEAIALGHDLGHTPFGHAGERILHEIMTPQPEHKLGKDCALSLSRWPDGFPEELMPLLGFKHNLQSLTVAMDLEKNYPQQGLDLTSHTLWGMAHHSRIAYKKGPTAKMLGYYDRYMAQGCCLPDGQEAWSLEGLLVAEADEIAQRHHDVEDALIGGLLTPEQLLALMNKHLGPEMADLHLNRQDRALLNRPAKHNLAHFNALISRILVNMMVTTLTRTAVWQINELCRREQLNGSNFHRYRLSHAFDCEQMKRILSYTDGTSESTEKKNFKDRVNAFIDEVQKLVLRSPMIQAADQKGQDIITDLFRRYYQDPRQLPEQCYIEFLSEYHRLSQLPGMEKWFRADTAAAPEPKLRRKSDAQALALTEPAFLNIVGEPGTMLPGEEILLMRTICNHIACMTDDSARKTLAAPCGKV